jgi:hypothetical protein
VRSRPRPRWSTVCVALRDRLRFEEAWVSVPLPFGEADGPLAERVEAALAGLDETDLGRHPEAFEATNRALLTELEQLEGL